MIGAWTTLRFREAYTPRGGGPAGHIEMTLWASGRVRVAHVVEPSAVFDGKLVDGVWAELVAHLQAAGFPNLPKPADAEGRGALLSVVPASGPLEMMWIWPAHRRDPRLDRAMRLLEAIAHGVSNGLLSFYHPIERAVIG